MSAIGAVMALLLLQSTQAYRPAPVINVPTGLGGMAAHIAANRGRIFNAADFGAVDDDSTNNTAAFSACLDALVAAGGGRMVLPRTKLGIYRGNIIIPPVDEWATVEIVADVPPAPAFGTVGALQFCSNCSHVVIHSLEKSGPAVISVTSSAPRQFSSVFIDIQNIEVRTYDNSAISGIDILWAQQCNLLNVFINTGTYGVQATQPTYGTAGLITPADNNGAYTMLRNIVVTGYTNGIVCNEHTDGDGIVVAENINGLSFSSANHASRFARVGAYRNSYNIAVQGRHGFVIQELAIETVGPGQSDAKNAWQKTVADVHDPANQSYADIVYWVVEGAVGPVTTWSMVGAANVQARRLGSPPACRLKSDDMAAHIAANGGRIFNAADFGAVDDDSTNNTAAFSACLDALVAAGGGRMVLPRTKLGIYRGNIIIPPVDEWATVEIAGSLQPPPIVGTVGKETFCSNCSHTVVQSLEKSGPAVIFVSPAPGQYASFSSAFVTIRDLEVRTYDNPSISGIDLGYAQQCSLQNVFVNTAVYSVQAGQPTHGTSGIVTPFVNNGAYTMLRNIAVSGYFNGIVCNEHTDGDGMC